MFVSSIKDAISKKDDAEKIVWVVYDKDEANEHIANNLCNECDSTHDEENLTDDEWTEVVSNMEKDDGVWNEFNSAFIYYVEQIIQKRKGNK